MQPQMQTTKQPAPQPQRDLSKTYYLGPSDENEHQIALAWIDQNHPNANKPGQVRYVTELRLDRMTEEHTVIVLARTGKKRTPARETERDHNGIARVITREPETLIGELSESKPVYCKDHWFGQEDGTEGELVVHTFLEAIGKACSPWAVKPAPADSRTTPRIYRLGWA
jgi:hypothetical protein